MIMKSKYFIVLVSFLFISVSCCRKEEISATDIIFLHHSTGGYIWEGKTSNSLSRLAGRISGRLAKLLNKRPELPTLFEEYNRRNNKNYSISELAFPKASPYGWKNYPFDYYNIWVKNAGNTMFMEEPTLEILTRDHQVIIFKHCFPVSNIQADLDSADINSELKTISNYKLQYYALRDKLHQFPETKFILFTGAIQVKSNIMEEEALRAREFFTWVVDEWDISDDNIYLWDLYLLQTEGGLFFKDEYAFSSNDSHPNEVFAGKVVRLLFNRIIDVIENNGRATTLSGEGI